MVVRQRCAASDLAHSRRPAEHMAAGGMPDADHPVARCADQIANGSRVIPNGNSKDSVCETKSEASSISGGELPNDSVWCEEEGAEFVVEHAGGPRRLVRAN